MKFKVLILDENNLPVPSKEYLPRKYDKRVRKGKSLRTPEGNATRAEVHRLADTGKYETMTCLAAEIGVSRERVRQIANEENLLIGHMRKRYAEELRWPCPECGKDIVIKGRRVNPFPKHMPAHCRPCSKLRQQPRVQELLRQADILRRPYRRTRTSRTRIRGRDISMSNQKYVILGALLGGAITAFIVTLVILTAALAEGPGDVNCDVRVPRGCPMQMQRRNAVDPNLTVNSR